MKRITLDLPNDEAAALAQFCKRVDSETVHRFASPCATYDDQPEGDVMWSGVLKLQRALADAGFAPR